ncbi:MAG: 16S rRNA (uracil(1498)-N(3))-methyltransferase [Rubrivivax sp.]|nr:MAG: 16S rRNA (uracil(1498)-N(3))-methyltransferase [Rubrivivax sp.]
MTPRLYVEGLGLVADAELSLPEGGARHIQVLRLQPGDKLSLFNGQGGEWQAQVTQMGRREVAVRVLSHQDINRELAIHVTLALGMPANDRMDNLVEKATELGVGAIQPLVCERSVLRLEGERAAKKVAHWHGVAVAASEQSGRTVVPTIAPVMTLKQWLGQAPDDAGTARAVLSFSPQQDLLAWQQAQRRQAPSPDQPLAWCFLSGPEGGLSPAEEAMARAAGHAPIGLGPRVLRADTAPLMVLSCLAALQAQAEGGSADGA